MELVEFMQKNGRLYKNRYSPELLGDLHRLLMQYRDQYDIHLYFKDHRTGLPAENPYYYIGHRTLRGPRSPLGNMRQSNRRVNNTYRVHERKRKRKQTRKRR